LPRISETQNGTTAVLIAGNGRGPAETIESLLLRGDPKKFGVQRATSYDAAIKAIAEETHDICFVGETLSGRSGIEFIRETVASGWCVPVILLTNPGGNEAGLEAIAAGAMDYLLAEQLEPESLARAIRHGLDRKRTSLQLRDERQAKAELQQQLLDLQAAKEDFEELSAQHARVAEELYSAREDIKGALDKAEESERRYRTLSESSPVGIWHISFDGKTLYANAAMNRIFNMNRDDDLSGDHYEAYVGGDGRKIMEEHLAILSGGETAEWELEITPKGGGDSRYVVVSGAPLLASDGVAKSALTTVIDITDRKKAEESMRRLAMHDPLTDLPNRVMFQDRLSHALAQAHRNGSQFAVLYLDLDHFKIVNDTLGHPTGDLLLKGVAKRLLRCVRETDTVARLGGDEFAIIAPDLKSGDYVVALAERIIKSLGEAFILQGQKVYTATSIGITAYPTDDTELDTLIKNADLALYAAKESGRGLFKFFTPEMNAKAVSRVAIEKDLRQAIEGEEFALLYQPIIDLRTRHVISAEALLRWHHPKKGIMPPDEFMPVAEDSGLIGPIGEWVLRTALKQAKDWQEAAARPPGVSINLSSRQIRHGFSKELVTKALGEAGLSPDMLTIEITESLVMEDTGSSIDLMKSLKDIGVILSLDDFGTGYSSLSYLNKFPVDYVKIDRSFVRDITVDKDDAVLIEAIITMAHRLHLRVVAEGVEKKEQLEFLRSQGCDFAQGYYFSKPVAIKSFVEFIRNWSRKGGRANPKSRPA
jgi:diguanylate cyclase (GGDEF)-like protein/PAS domain S-box-containing protein